MIARVNDPRNQEHFDLLGITQTVCATSNILGLVEHEVPEHGFVHMLELRKENLEIVELQIDTDSPVAGKRVAGLDAPGARADLGRCGTAAPSSPWTRPSSGRATRCSRSSSRARRTSSASAARQEGGGCLAAHGRAS